MGDRGPSLDSLSQALSLGLALLTDSLGSLAWAWPCGLGLALGLSQKCSSSCVGSHSPGNPCSGLAVGLPLGGNAALPKDPFAPSCHRPHCWNLVSSPDRYWSMYIMCICVYVYSGVCTCTCACVYAVCSVLVQLMHE
jgi:hypothetical protein